MVAKVLWKSSRRKKVKKSYVNYKNKNMPDVDSIKKEERKKVYIKNIIVKEKTCGLFNRSYWWISIHLNY